MLDSIIVLVLTTLAPIDSLDRVAQRLQDGVPPAALVAEIESGGIYLPIQPRQAVQLYFDGVPAEVLAAVFRTGGSTPRVAVRDGELELLYASYRIVGRRGAQGPQLVVSGYDDDGERLAPPMTEPLPPPLPVARFEPEPEPTEIPAVMAPSLTTRAEPVRVEIAVVDERRVEPPPASGWQSGAPEFVSYSQVPVELIQGAQVVVPWGTTFVTQHTTLPGGVPPAFGLASYGFGQTTAVPWPRTYVTTPYGAPGYVAYQIGGAVTPAREQRPRNDRVRNDRKRSERERVERERVDCERVERERAERERNDRLRRTRR